MSSGMHICIIYFKLKKQQQICCREQFLQLFIEPAYQYICNQYTIPLCKGVVLDNVCIYFSTPFSQMFIEPLVPVDAQISCFSIENFNLEFENRCIQQCFKRSFSDRHEYSLKF